MNCLGRFALLLLSLAASCCASDESSFTSCTESKGMCRPRACCRDENHLERAIGMTSGCKASEVCCSNEVKIKLCMNGTGSCLPLGCCPNKTDTIVIKEHNDECGPFAICCQYEAAVVKPVCILKDSTPTCGAREIGISESTDIRANRWEFPWSVAIFEVYSMFDKEFKVFLCGGSLLEDGRILTTAECIEEQMANSLQVHVGRWDLVLGIEECSQMLRVSRIVRHDGYNATTKKNNIALLLTGSIVQWSSAVNPICLPTSARSASDLCYIIGWDSESTLSVNYMLKFKVRTNDSSDECRRSVNTNFPSSTYVLSSEHGCASVVDTMDKHYPCARVTGSGVVCQSNATPGQYYLRGIALYALRNCSLSSINDLYVDVNSYTDWIRKAPRK